MKPEKELAKLCQEATALAKSPAIKSQEGRLLSNLLLRLHETLVYGEPKTKPVPTHHE